MAINRDYAFGREISLQLCEILGLDPGTVTGLKLNLDRNSIATVEITRVVTGDEAKAFVQAIEQYDFVKRVK